MPPTTTTVTAGMRGRRGRVVRLAMGDFVLGEDGVRALRKEEGRWHGERRATLVEVEPVAMVE
jgi:hypothetical protein